MSTRITEYRLDPDKNYLMLKLLSNGKRKFMSIGTGTTIKVDCGCFCGGMVTTAVQEITIVGKGIIIETLNSTYLIEEYTGGGIGADFGDEG